MWFHAEAHGQGTLTSAEKRRLTIFLFRLLLLLPLLLPFLTLLISNYLLSTVSPTEAMIKPPGYILPLHSDPELT